MSPREKAKEASGPCEQCRKPIVMRGRLGRRFCSDACRYAWHRERTKRGKNLLNKLEERGSI